MLALRGKNAKEFWIASFIIFLALVLRLYTIGDRSLWMDEIWQVDFYFSNSVGELVKKAAVHAQPPLDYLIGYLLLKVFSFSETIVRLPAAIFGTLTVGLVYLLARRLSSQNVAIMAALLSAVSNSLVAYSQEARPYSIFIFALFLTLYLYFRVMDSGTKLCWLGFGISLYFLLLTRGLEPIIAILVINIISLLYFALSRNTFYTAAISAVAFLLYLPFFRLIYYALQYFSERQKVSVSLWEDISHRLQDFPLGGMIWMGYEFTRPVSLLFLIFMGLGFYTIFVNKEKSKARIYATFALLMPLFHVFIYTYKVDLKASPFNPRYYIYLLPIFYIITAIGIETLWRSARDRAKRPYLSYGAGLIIFIFFIFFSANLNGYYKSEKHDWRGVSYYIKQATRSENIIVTDSPLYEYGKWNLRFEGRHVYYRDAREYNLNELVDYALEHQDFKGEIFLVLYYWRPEYHGNYLNKLCNLCASVLNYGGRGLADRINTLIDKMIAEYRTNKLEIPCCEKLCEKSFYHLCVYKLDYNGEKFIDRVDVLIDRMIAEYPENGSRVDIYLNKGKIAVSRGDMDEAMQYLEKARQYVPKESADQLEREIRRIL